MSKITIELAVCSKGGLEEVSLKTLQNVLLGFNLQVKPLVEMKVEKKEAVKQTEKGVEEPKEVKPIPKPTPKPKKAPEPNIGLGDLKELAKNVSIEKGREAVKGAISKYGAKLTDVKESDYEALATELKGL